MNSALSALRAFSRSRPSVAPGEGRCDLCGAGVAALHEHLLESAPQALRCVCGSCAVLFGQGRQKAGGRYLRVHRRVERLADFRLDDAAWSRLRIPIRVAFFVRLGEGVVGRFPSPAGATESLVEAEDWRALAGENPILGSLAPEVEALLVNRLGDQRGHFLVSIDHCYRLVGLVRQKWRGLGGGTDAHEAIDGFFAELENG